jgi:GNAT superfamily N-acetyltransferase
MPTLLLTADVGAGTCRRVTGSLRGQGIGNLMVRWAIDESRRRGCTLVQLTTHKSRTAAHRTGERLGFEAGHEGMKLTL